MPTKNNNNNKSAAKGAKSTTGKKQRGLLAQDNKSSGGKTYYHHVTILNCPGNIQVALMTRTKPSGEIMDTFFHTFVENMDFDKYNTDGTMMLRDDAQSNNGKPKQSNPDYKWMVIVKLPQPNENSILNPKATFDHEAEGAAWGQLLCDGLNGTEWQYGDMYKKYPFQYGGINTSHAGVAPLTCLDQVFLNHDIVRIVKALYGGEIPETIPEDVLDQFFSDRESNDPYAILGLSE